jgi:soluble lytic murein transglycosylase-like protein
MRGFSPMPTLHIDALRGPSKDFYMGYISHWLSPVLLIFGYSVCAAQDRQELIKQKVEAAAARQRASVTAMASSVERQMASLQRHSKSDTTAGYFMPPPAERLLPDLPVQSAPECDILAPAEIDSLIDQASRQEGVAPDLIRGVMKQESAFRPCAISAKGALGLMQLMPQTAADFEVADPFNPSENVTAGARLLRRLLQHYDGNLALTLGAYNAGVRRVDADEAVPEIPETMDYVRRILSFMPMSFLTGAQLSSPVFDSDSDH